MTAVKFYLREFQPDDIAEIYQLFYDTIHSVNLKDYTAEQVDAWAPKQADLAKWQNSLANNYTLIAINKADGKIIGFADLENNGYLNRGFVHKDFQGRGIGKALLLARESKAISLGVKKLFSDVSITAKPFFEKNGYITEKQQSKELNGVTLINYRMTKDLTEEK